MSHATCTDPSCPHGRRNLAVRQAADLNAAAANQAVADGRTIMKLRKRVNELRSLSLRQYDTIRERDRALIAADKTIGRLGTALDELRRTGGA